MSKTRTQDTTDRQTLDLQLCFPLYAASRLVTRLYQPMLEPLGLTYPQYVVMMILWEDAPCSIQHIGHRAILNSNTLTPLLKKLQKQGLIDRQRNATDERSVRISLTISGKKLKKQCQCIPGKLIASFPKTSMPKLKELKEQLDELIKLIQDQNEPA